jgi:hypothetical protein
MQNPFELDADNNITIAPPDIDDGTGKYTNWPSAEGYEKIPDNWKPVAGRELPALRCTHERDDGSRCKKFGVRGTGFNGTPSMCFIHGGSLPSVKAKAEATLLSVRMRLVQSAPAALEGLIDLAENPQTGAAIKLKAYTEILDRAGIKGGFEVNVEITSNVSAADEISKKLALMHERMNADTKQIEEDLTDLGEVAEPEED